MSEAGIAISKLSMEYASASATMLRSRRVIGAARVLRFAPLPQLLSDWQNIDHVSDSLIDEKNELKSSSASRCGQRKEGDTSSCQIVGVNPANHHT
jgi:hypothetical protein